MSTTVTSAAHGLDHTLQERCERLLSRWTQTEDPDERTRVRDDVVAAMLPLARQIARRYRDRGEPVEDLEQIAVLGLLGALDRFDPSRGSDFVAFARPTMAGEVKRHFRDHGWSVRPPRRLQELGAAVREATGRLTQQLAHAPTVQELAEDLAVDPEEVLEAIGAHAGYSTDSLDASAGDHEQQGAHLADVLGEYDERLTRVEDWHALAPAIRALPEQHRRILALRFGSEWTQSQIAAEIGVSQMQVSRLLAQILRRLRRQLV